MPVNNNRKGFAGKDPSFNALNKQANQQIINLFKQINGQSPFDQNALQNQETAIMQNYEQQMAPTFQAQKDAFQQMAAERGWDPTSQAFGQAYQQQVTNPQNMARTQMLGQAQQNAFNQARGMYQMPYEMMAAYNPYLQYQGNIGQLQWQYNHRPRGGGGANVQLPAGIVNDLSTPIPQPAAAGNAAVQPQQANKTWA